ncbi:putative bifunctional diguanylate cyclase/phosphodiesterase [Leucobacter denitrificans]|uniref:Bifunctional diguanylate cyclase/phosphodiesterase n=1 Tax=Leucobacter denitrificans TaxID=683042 RepID=A0A7G9S787_9MICO|nr:bifunctional diguanylate cyclase/phosphodiesterase [Leucobacter denitrificans]QNN63712.1 bifunctional diguanylate cyclase/phosphodiesterase [Leucobacter denitrificans]
MNDRYGRNAGDDLLKAVAGRFNGFVNAPTKLFQYSGDNFMIVHRHDEDSEAFTFASAVEKLLRAPFVVGGQDLIISASIGVCVFPQYGYDRDSLIRRSEDAMLEAKRPGRSHITFFRELASDEDSRLLRLEFALRHALTNEELSIVYQPQVAVNTGEVHGAEALLRWNHPELGPISPAEFIPIAERSGLIHEIGMWVIENACQQLRTWHHLGHANLRLAVNASIDQFYDAEFYERLERAIQVSGIDPESLVIEVTESIAANADTVVEQLQRLKSLGVSIALDDFGTGYSSLQYLRSFPVDYLKIDRSFTSGLGSNDTDHNLVATVIDLARSFGLYTIAEGVETGEQLRILHELGAPLAQGFHISRPISPDEFGVWIDQYSA